MIRFLIILSFEFLFSTASALNSPEIHRKNLESRFDDYINEQLMSQPFDTSVSFLTDMIEKSSKAQLWDVTLISWVFIAYIADIYRQYDIMENALQECSKLMHERAGFLDSLDPAYILRADAVILQGQFFSRQNKFEKAESIYLALIDRLLKITPPDKATIFKTYAFLCDMYMDRGLYEKVYPYYLLMEKLLPDDENLDGYRYKHKLYMGTYFVRKKDYHSALKAVRSIDQKIYNKRPDETASVITEYLDLMGIIFKGLHAYDSSMIYFERSLQYQDPKMPSITDTYELYADCLADFGEYRKSLIYYQKSDSFFSNSRSSFNTFKKAQILSKISDVQFRLKLYRNSLKSVQQAFYTIYQDSSYLQNLARNPALSSIQPDKVIIRLLISKSSALYALAEIFPDKPVYLKSSLNTCLLTTKITDKFRHEISTDDFKQYFVSDIRPMYEKAVNACWKSWQNNKSDSLINLALYFMEKSKNQILLDAISVDYAGSLTNLPQKVVQSGNNFRTKLVSLQNLITNLRDKDDSLLMNKAQIDFAETRNEYESYLKMLKANYPEYYNFKFNNDVPDIRGLKKATGNSVVVEYMVGRNFISIVAVNRRKSLFLTIPVNMDFRNTVGILLENINKSPYSNGKSVNLNYESFTKSAYSLYNTLFRQIRSEFRTSDNFIIITDGILSYIPFDILLEKLPDDSEKNYASLDYLLKSSVIRYEYSASILMRNFKTRLSTGKLPDYIGFSPEYSQISGLRKVKVLGHESSFLLRPLKYSNEEIALAASVFKGKIFTGNRAVAEQFKAKSSSSKIIHFAGHTFVNDSTPELSCLLFSESPGGTTETYTGSGMLYINEILNLNLNASLVLLSTCESGSGKLLQGEGLISIGRSFCYAGAQSMVMTLWKINDQSAAEIIKSFCISLKKGKKSSVSLRNAKLAFLANTNPKNSHPFYWAAYIFTGNDGPVMKNNFSVVFTLLILAIIILSYIAYGRSSFRYIKLTEYKPK